MNKHYARQGDAAWQMLWIGHPWRSTRRTGAVLEISNQHEGGGALEVEHRIDVAALADAIRRARAELHGLADRLHPVVAAHLEDAARTRELVRSLAGLSGLTDA